METTASTSSKSEPRHETRRCPLPCGRVFEVAIHTVAGRELPAPTLCPGCLEARVAPVVVERGDSDMREALHDCGVNVWKHGGCTIDGWEAGDSAKPADAARGFVAAVIGAGRFDEVRGLYLCGDTGTGKTHLAVACLRGLLEEDYPARRIRFDRADRLITEIQDTYGTGGTGKVLDRRERAGVWVIDDLGAEKATDDVLRILTDLFSSREGRPTIVTSNFDPGKLATRWRSEALARLSSRLGPQNYRAVRVTGTDRRFAA